MTQNMFFLCCPFAVRLPLLPSPCQALTLSAMQKWQLHWRLRPEAFFWLVGIVTIATAVIVIYNTYLNFYCVRHYLKHFINEETEALRDFRKERGGKASSLEKKEGLKKPPHGFTPSMSDSYTHFLYMILPPWKIQKQDKVERIPTNSGKLGLDPGLPYFFFFFLVNLYKSLINYTSKTTIEYKIKWSQDPRTPSLQLL